MKQRLCLARTLAHDPQVLILDEPASGLDPRARIEIRELLVELARLGKTIFFSTHILADVAEICTEIGIIEAGRLVAHGQPEEMHRRLIPHRRLVITLLNGAAQAMAALQGHAQVAAVTEVKGGEKNGGVNSGQRATLQIDFAGDDEAVAALLGDLVRQGLPVIHLTEETRDLEEVFMRATKGIVS
jgi:ABC-2 type transport system ATP-binding protein